MTLKEAIELGKPFKRKHWSVTDWLIVDFRLSNQGQFCYFNTYEPIERTRYWNLGPTVRDLVSIDWEAKLDYENLSKTGPAETTFKDFMIEKYDAINALARENKKLKERLDGRSYIKKDT